MKRLHFPQAPSRQVALIGTVFVVAGAIVLTLGLGQLQRARGELDQLDRQLIPATVDLASADRDFADSTQRFRALLASAGGLNNPEIALITDLHTNAADHWRAFKPFAAELPGNRRLVTAVDTAIGYLSDIGAKLLLSPVPADVVSYNAATSVLDRDLGILSERFTRAVRRSSSAARQDADTTLWTALGAYGVALVAIVSVTFVAARRAQRRELDAARSAAERTRRADRDRLSGRLQRGLEMARDEGQSFEVVDAAMREAFNNTQVELLIGDSSQEHLRRAAGNTDGPATGSTCAVTNIGDCPAASRNQTVQFERSDDLDSCPFLRRRPGGLCTATCAPVGVMGKSTGVACAIGNEGHALDADGVARLELITRKTGERLTMLRSFARTHTQANTDPLTSLANRRSLEQAAQSMTDAGRPYVVAFADLDHFKLLNDEHGHDTGDRALQLFARVLRDSVRPGDFPARYGGEEFVVVLPDCTVSDATRVLDRVRGTLRDALTASDLPEFTVSFGLSAPDAMRSFDDVVTEADGALLDAKTLGRDRVVGPSDADEGDTPNPPIGLVVAG